MRKAQRFMGNGFSNSRGGSWTGVGWGNKPPKSEVVLLPVNMGKPFIKRFMEWWTCNQ